MAQHRSDSCDYPGCANQIRESCEKCRRAFCPRHIVTVGVPSGYGGRTAYRCKPCIDALERGQSSGCVFLLTYVGFWAFGILIVVLLFYSLANAK